MNKKMRGKGLAPSLTEQVRLLRSNQTKAESIFWNAVRNRQIADKKFRRQHQIGPFIVDFCCIEAKLIIEIDGGYHNTPEQLERDKIREAFLQTLGYQILRFKNAEVEDNTMLVVKKLSDRFGGSC